MSSVDKFGIIFVIVITTIAVAFTTTGGLSIESETISKTNLALESTSELELEMKVAQKASEDIQKLQKDIEQKTEQAQELTKEAVGAKLPAKFVSITRGSSIPGCEKANLCYDPPNAEIFAGGEIIWRNDDLSPHTVTSGIVITGPDGNFDSGLISVGEVFSHRFDDTGEFPYFCMIHPWATGKVTVS